MIRCSWCIEWKACITNSTFGTNVIIVHMVTMTYEDPLVIESWQSKTSEMISSQWCYNYYFPKLSFFFFSLLKPHMFGNETITWQKDFTLWKLIGRFEYGFLSFISWANLNPNLSTYMKINFFSFWKLRKIMIHFICLLWRPNEISYGIHLANCLAHRRGLKNTANNGEMSVVIFDIM